MKRTFYQSIMGDAVPQTPWDFTHYGQKHVKRGSALYTAPMLKSPTTALGVHPCRALSSELAKTEYQNHKKRQLVKKMFDYIKVVSMLNEIKCYFPDR